MAEKRGFYRACHAKLQRFRDIYIATLEAMKPILLLMLGDSPIHLNSRRKLDQLKEQALHAFESLKLTTSYEEAFSHADLVIEAIC